MSILLVLMLKNLGVGDDLFVYDNVYSIGLTKYVFKDFWK